MSRDSRGARFKSVGAVRAVTASPGRGLLLDALEALDDRPRLSLELAELDRQVSAHAARRGDYSGERDGLRRLQEVGRLHPERLRDRDDLFRVLQLRDLERLLGPYAESKAKGVNDD